MKDENFNIFVVLEKIQVLGGGGSRETNIQGRLV